MQASKRAIAILVCLAGLASLRLFAQELPDLPRLFQQLQIVQTTDHAAQQFLRLAKSDPKVKNYLIVQLPPMIEKDPKDSPRPWSNAVRLADDLKIIEAAPSLVKWIGLSTGGTISLAQVDRLDYSPAGKALVHLGDPAVPALAGVLAHGSPPERVQAVRILDLIGSARAKSALREHVESESNPDLRQYIYKILNIVMP